MNARQLILGCCLGLGLIVPAGRAMCAEAQVPVLDLRQAELNLERGFTLKPDWEFYWQQFLTPADLQSGQGLLSGVLNQEVFKKKEGVFYQGLAQKQGYLTLRTRIFLPQSYPSMLLTLSNVNSAYKIWIDGQFVTEVGKLAADRELSQGVSQPFTYELQPKPAGHEILLQMSNFKSNVLGPQKPFILFHKESYEVKRHIKMLLDSFLIGAVIVMSFYHFALFLIRRSEPAALHFGLFCLVVALRFMVMSEGFVSVFRAYFGALDLVIINRIDILGFTGGAICFYNFVRALYSKEVPRWAALSIQFISYAYSLLALCTDQIVYLKFLQAYQLAVVIAGFIIVYSLVLAIKRRREGARIFVLGFAVMFSTIINDILHGNQVIYTFEMFSLGLFTFVLAQSIILSKRFAKAFLQVSFAEKEIRSLNDDLERKVIERTKTIRTILDNVRSGFLMIDAEFRILDGFTKSCWEILGPEVAAKVPLVEVFDLTKRERMQLQLALGQVFDDSMPEDVALAQIPHHFKLGRKIVAVQGALIRDSQGKAEALLLSISDASQLVKAELESSKNKSLLKIISEKSSFRAFIKDSLESLEACLSLTEQQDQRGVAMILHTLKGNFALYGLEPIASFIHEIEEKNVLSKLDIKAIVQTVEDFIVMNGAVLGLEAHGLEISSYEVTGDSLQKLETDLYKAHANRTVLQALNNWMRDVRMVPVRELLGPIEANAERVADVLGKHIRLEMLGAELRVDPERMRHPLKNLIHAVINSIDHGIEYPEERGDKDPTGKVKLTFCYDELAHLKVVVEDDGRGIDVALIRHLALDKGLVTEQELERMDEGEIQALIFRQGFSTKSQISEFSGRGVGIAALEFAVRSLGGQIAIRSIAHQGTIIDISIPTEKTVELLTGIA